MLAASLSVIRVRFTCAVRRRVYALVRWAQARWEDMRPRPQPALPAPAPAPVQAPAPAACETGPLPYIELSLVESGERPIACEVPTLPTGRQAPTLPTVRKAPARHSGSETPTLPTGREAPARHTVREAPTRYSGLRRTA